MRGTLIRTRADYTSDKRDVNVLIFVCVVVQLYFFEDVIETSVELTAHRDLNLHDSHFSPNITNFLLDAKID